MKKQNAYQDVIAGRNIGGKGFWQFCRRGCEVASPVDLLPCQGELVAEVPRQTT